MMETLNDRMRALANEPIEVRVSRLVRLQEDNWHVLQSAIEQALDDYIDMMNGETSNPKDEPLPEIEDRRSFIAYVSLVARKQHAGALTGKEAGALLYAAQLVYAALKGGEVHGLPPQAALP